MKTALHFIFFILLPITSFSQEHQKKISIIGYTYESDSLKILPDITISVNRRIHFRSDQRGKFTITVGRTDTIDFTGIGYKKATLNLGEASYDLDTLFLDIVMEQQAFEMMEATIVPFHSYDELKTAIINMDPDPANLGQLSDKNMDLIMKQNKVVEGPGLDAYGNYRLAIQRLTNDGSPLIILSTDPTKGIFALMNKLGIIMPWARKK
jgi:hypothetical protein